MLISSSVTFAVLEKAFLRVQTPLNRFCTSTLSLSHLSAISEPSLSHLSPQHHSISRSLSSHFGAVSLLHAHVHVLSFDGTGNVYSLLLVLKVVCSLFLLFSFLYFLVVGAFRSWTVEFSLM